MTTAVFIRHLTQPGKRDDVRVIWEKHMAPAVSHNPDHLRYYYCFDNQAPDVILAFQEYADATAAAAFLKTPEYLAYVQEVEPLLSGPPEVTVTTVIWNKNPLDMKESS